MRIFTLASLTLFALVWTVAFFPAADAALDLVGASQTTLSAMEALHYLLYPLLFGLAGITWSRPKELFYVGLSSWLITLAGAALLL